MLKPATIYDNAMLYKDITQWLRNRTFLTLFIGLLGAAEILSIVIVSLPLDRGTAGPAAFGFLAGFLSLYSLVIALLGYNLTAREFQNRTFELFELSGMSLEKMIAGKLVSMLVQFLFGFFCIVPFMFFAYLLGGLDFYAILASTVTLAFCALPLYLGSLTVALHSRRVKNIGVLVRIGVGLMAVFILPQLLMVLAFGFFGRGSSSHGPIELIKLIVALDPKAIGWSLVVLLFYAQICLLFFYLCCNAISPTNDSREQQVKLLATTLTVSWMGVFGWAFAFHPDNDLIKSNFAIYFLLCLVGLICFYGPIAVPLMVRKHREQARLLRQRLFYTLFEPGPRGTLRTIALLWGLVAVYGLLIYRFVMLGSASAIITTKPENLALLTLPLAVPFYLVFPIGLMLNFKAIRKNPASLRLVLLLWWGIVGAVLITGAAITGEHPFRDSYSGLRELLIFLSIVFSPVSSAVALAWENSEVLLLAPEIHLVLGVIGLFLMRGTVRRMEKLAQAAPAIPAAASASPAQPVTASGATPPPLPKAVPASAPTPAPKLVLATEAEVEVKSESPTANK